VSRAEGLGQDAQLPVAVPDETVPDETVAAVGQATLYWQKMPMLTVGDPSVATMTVPVAVFQVMRGTFPAGLAGA
jgi:hypothetical protein